jgi:AraC-like DNA-binding protein
MKPDMSDARRVAVDEVAHLRLPTDRSSVVHRYEAPHGLEDVLRRFWIPVWSVPPGEGAVQQVLQYPVALLIITPEYARFIGVSTGLSSTTLVGDGFGVGVMLQPAGGALLAGGSMAEWTDRSADLEEVCGAEGRRLVDRVLEAMAADPHAEASHRAAIGAVSELLSAHLPVDDEGLLVNRLVQFVEERSDVTRVAQLCDEFDISERTLQRLTNRRLGLKPKWLIQRRRLHEAAERLRTGAGDLAAVAAELGYADQSHLTRDWQSVTGLTPGEFAARYDGQ